MLSLMVGPAPAALALVLVAVAIALLGVAPAPELPFEAFAPDLVPVTAGYVAHLGSRRWLPANILLFVFVDAFLAGALSRFAAGAATCALAAARGMLPLDLLAF